MRQEKEVKGELDGLQTRVGQCRVMRHLLTDSFWNQRHIYLFITPIKYRASFARHCRLDTLGWGRAVTGAVRAEPLSSATDWAPPGLTRRVSSFPGPKCHCVCARMCGCMFCECASVCACLHSLCVENEKCCVVTFCGAEAPCHRWAARLTCVDR